MRLLLMRLCVCLGPFLTHASLAAADPLLVGTASEWVLNQKPESCFLEAPVAGARGQTLTLGLVPTQDVATLGIGGDSRIGGLRNLVSVDVLLIPSGQRFTSSAMLSVEPDTGKRIFAIWELPEAFLEQVRTASALAVERKGRSRFQVQLSISDKAIGDLRACNDKLLERWGLNPAALASLKQKPKPLKGVRIVEADDYPMEALRNSEQGTAIARFTIDVNGRAKNCIIVESSGSKALDSTDLQIATIARQV